MADEDPKKSQKRSKKESRVENAEDIEKKSFIAPTGEDPREGGENEGE